MIKFSGHPKSSALFYWIDRNHEMPGQVYFASFLTISPIPFYDEHIAAIDRLSYMYPIMFHEPMEVKNLDEVVMEARERNSSIVDCGETTIDEARNSLRTAVGEYLTNYLSYTFELEQRSTSLLDSPIRDLSFKKIRGNLVRMNTQDRLSEITQLTGTIRTMVERGESEYKIAAISEQINQLRPESECDREFDGFLRIIRKPGKIAQRMTEVYITEFHNRITHNMSVVEECREDISSFEILLKLDELRHSTRHYIQGMEIEKTIQTLEHIFQIKEMNPHFCSGEDLDSFCEVLSRKGEKYDILSEMYINKYFCIIDKKFVEAGAIHEKIREALKDLP